MLTETINGTTYTYTYDKVGNLTSYAGIPMTYNSSGWRDQMLTYNGYQHYYDAMGNATSYYSANGRWNFTWDGRELTSAVIKNSGNPITYSYDENGLRLTKTVVNGTSTTEHTYLYAADGTLLREIREYSDGTTDTMEFLYDHSGQPYSFTLNNVTYYYILNLQGDVVRIVDGWGRTVASYTYNAWGKLLNTTTTSVSNAANVADKNPLRYRGYYYDAESKLYYLQSRYYDPYQGRFINPDAFTSTGQGIIGNNMYAYCGNNPVINADSSGQFFFTVLGAAIGGITGALDSWMTGGDILKGAIAGATSGAIAGAGVDIGIAITAATGGAGVGAGVAIAAVMGGIGSAVGTGISSNWTAESTDYLGSALVGGLTNIVSFGLAPIGGEIIKGSLLQIVKSTITEGFRSFGENTVTGFIVAGMATLITKACIQ